MDTRLGGDILEPHVGDLNSLGLECLGWAYIGVLYGLGIGTTTDAEQARKREDDGGPEHEASLQREPGFECNKSHEKKNLG